jgi:hypothetical protein
MKRLACVFALFASQAFAGTMTLPEPTVQSISGAYCGAYFTPNDTQTTYTRQAITGWSADGTQVYAETYGKYPCGHSGRGSNITYYPWCGTFTWTVTLDSSGNLNPIAVATFTSTPGACGTYYQWQWSQVFYNSLGYGATMTPVALTYGYQKLVATLITP